MGILDSSSPAFPHSRSSCNTRRYGRRRSASVVPGMARNRPVHDTAAQTLIPPVVLETVGDRRGARVVLVVPSLFDQKGCVLGGAERYVLELARHMADVVPSTLVAFGDAPRTEHHGALEIRVVAAQ